MAKQFAIRNTYKAFVTAKEVHQSILRTNPQFSKKVDYNSLFYAVVVECDNKPETLLNGLIEWIELTEL